MSWILDVAFFVVIIGAVALGASRGLLKCVSKLAGTLFAIVFAFAFCISFELFLENVFGMTSAIANGLVGWLSGNEALSVELGGVTTAEELSVFMPAFFANIIAGVFAGQPLPEGSTGATLIAPIVAKWIAVAICFIALIIIIKLAVWLLAKLLTGVIENITPLRLVNRLCGAVFGGFCGCLFLFIALAICHWIPVPEMHAFISSSTIVGTIFTSNWFIEATSYIASFQWLNDYLLQYLT